MGFSQYYPSYLVPRRPIHHRHTIAFFLLLSVLLMVILVSGCISTAAQGPNIYAVELKYDSFGTDQDKGSGIINTGAYQALNSYANTTDLKLHINYFGLCSTSSVNGKNETGWFCSNDINAHANRYNQSSDDPLNLLYAGFQLKNHVISPWLLVISTCLTFFSMVTMIITKTAQSYAFGLATLLCVLAFVFSLMGMVWQQTATNAAVQLAIAFSNQAIQGTIGVSTAGLGWVTALFLSMCAVGLVIIFYTEKTIEYETGEAYHSTPGIPKHEPDMMHSHHGLPTTLPY
ncbi:hypothetical protein TRVA0_008S02718 [Trichomonascus vanleenenianus]|uniref:Fig1 domain-containing protein n=1 Tax=Trichomonascus vanleenenianus TaxID=2268995 RepID=UPI003ECAA7CF